MANVSRRTFVGQLAGLAAATALPARSLATPAASSPRPNVLLFFVDDLRVELSSYGSIFGARTPHMDALGAAGVRFDRNYCQFPLCNPSRSSVLTGRHPTRTGVLGNRSDFRKIHPDWVSLPQLFRENGYTSIRCGKIFHGGLDDPKAWSIGGGVPDGPGGAGGHTIKLARTDGTPPPAYIAAPLPQDVSQADYTDRCIVLDGMGEGHPDYATADAVIKHLQEHDRTQPFFIGCGFVKPHSPPAAPQKFLDQYPADQIKLTPDFAHWPTVPPGFPSAAIRKRNADLFIGRSAGEAEARAVIQTYIASASWTDWNLGRVMAELDRQGLRENTIVVLIADHGYQLGEKGKWSKAGSLFENGTRVPLVIAAPGQKGNGTACHCPVESINLYPTLVSLCGLPLPEGTETASLLPLLENPAHDWGRPAYSVWSEDGHTLHGVAVRTARWRYAEFGLNGVNGAMLFDEAADPYEMTNLADLPEHAATVQELSALTRAYAATLPERTSDLRTT